MRRFVYLLLCASAWTVWVPAVSRGDILHLKGGTRHQGRLISRDERQVVFEVALPGGGAAAVNRFPAELVERVELTAAPASQPVAASAESADQLSPAQVRALAEEALRLFDQNRPNRAIIVLTRIIDRSPPEALDAADRVLAARHPDGTVALAARTRFDLALLRDGGRKFRLRGVTRAEHEAMSGILARSEAEILASSFAGRPIEAWIASPDDYETLQPDAQRMVRDARLAACMIAERVKIDPTLDDNPAERRRLTALRDSIARFTIRVSNMNGFMSLGDENDPTSPAARALRRLKAQQAASQPSSGPARNLRGSLFDDEEP